MHIAPQRLTRSDGKPLGSYCGLEHLLFATKRSGVSYFDLWQTDIIMSSKLVAEDAPAKEIPSMSISSLQVPNSRCSNNC